MIIVVFISQLKMTSEAEYTAKLSSTLVRSKNNDCVIMVNVS